VLGRWMARPTRAEEIAFVLVFLLVAGVSAFVGVLIGLPRSPAILVTHLPYPQQPAIEAPVPTAAEGAVASIPGVQDCNKAVPWMQVCSGNRLAHPRVGASQSPTP